MSGLFPKAGDIRRYWQNILNRVDAVQEVPEERWRQDDFFDDDRLAPDKIYSKWGGFLDPLRFDPMKWKIPPASLASIDPIQLLSLEVADRAFQDAGYHDRPFPKERTGVIFACAGTNDVGSDYAFRTMMSHHLPRMKGISAEVQENLIEQTHDLMPEWTEDSFPGILTNVIAGRIANRFDLGGPNFTVDAACAASLAALYSAVAQLRVGAVDMMLVGAADGSNNAFTYMCFAKTHALSPRGKSRPFDNSADGIALGEGIAAVLIKRLDDAIRDGDKVYAVIRGIGSSSDGRNRSMTAPHTGGQILALKRAYADAGLPCETISLVEAHGTGTAVGDGTEIISLNTLYSQECTDKQFAAVGSVKSMIGHTKTCAGLASLVKTSLALKHKVLPPTLHVDHPNEKVDFQQSAFFINTETRPWFDELGDHPRRAGVSAFGFGGTNFHVVLEEAPATAVTTIAEPDLSPRSAEITTWKRNNRKELAESLVVLRDQLAKCPAEEFSQLAFSLRNEEQGHDGNCRLAIVAASTADFAVKLEKAIKALSEQNSYNDPTGIFYSEQTAAKPESVAFLFPGQGSQSINMLRDVAVLNSWAHPLFANANRQLREFFPKSLTRYIFPPPVFAVEDLDAERAALNETQVAQPALGTVEVFALELLKRFGVEPATTAGHSYGEYVALHAAGCLSRDDLLTLSGHRGRISAEVAHSSSPGAMAAVNASAAQIEEVIAAAKLEIHLANLNAPDQTIIAGTSVAVDRAVQELTDRGYRSRRLAVTGAFHTPEMAGAAEQLGEVLGSVKFHTPNRAVYSNTLAARYPNKPSEIRKLLQRHIVEPVLFEAQMRQMRADGSEIFLEVGPGRVLTGLMQRIFADNPPICLALDASGRDGVTQLAHLLGQLFVLGLPVDLSAWYDNRSLKAQPVADLLRQSEENRQPKRTEWILTTYSAKPVTPLPTRSVDREGLRAKFGKKAGGSIGTPAAVTKTSPPSVEAAMAASTVVAPLPASQAVPAVASVAQPTPNLMLIPSSLATASSPGMSPMAPSMPVVSFPVSGSMPNVPPSYLLRSSATMNSPMSGNHSEPMNSAGAQLIVQSQALMMQMLDLQKWQQQVALRFIDAHQQLVQTCATGVSLPAVSLEQLQPMAMPQPAAIAAAPVPQAMPAPAVVQAAPAPVVHAAPVARVAAAPATVRAPVTVNRAANVVTARVTVAAPVERKVAPAPARNGNGATIAPAAPENGPRAANGNGHSAPAVAPVAKAAPAAAAPASDSSLSVDKFRAALLKAVSERTGYPEDMLDETLPLESGLGIDSIKTVEIFSNLKDYHHVFTTEGQDQEEALKEFTQMKTLGDIISAYELHLQAQSSDSASSGNGQQVERYTLEAVDAGALNGEKKNSRLAT